MGSLHRTSGEKKCQSLKGRGRGDGRMHTGSRGEDNQRYGEN